MNLWPFVCIAAAGLLIATSRRRPERIEQILLPASVALIGVALWQLACDTFMMSVDTPTPGQTGAAFMEILRSNRRG